jgi:hypothetical protein
MRPFLCSAGLSKIANAGYNRPTQIKERFSIQEREVIFQVICLNHELFTMVVAGSST